MQKSVKKGRIRNHLANNKTNKKNLHHQWASQTPFLPLLVYEPLAFAAKLYQQQCGMGKNKKINIIDCGFCYVQSMSIGVSN